MSSSFCYVNPKHSLAKSSKVDGLVSKIMEKITEIPNYIEYKHSLELLTMVCVIIEHEIDNTKLKVKIDKKDIVYRCYTKIWEKFTPQELKDLGANIDYLWENGKIKRKSFLSVLGSYLCDWAKRRIL